MHGVNAWRFDSPRRRCARRPFLLRKEGEEILVLNVVHLSNFTELKHTPLKSVSIKS